MKVRSSFRFHPVLAALAHPDALGSDVGHVNAVIHDHAVDAGRQLAARVWRESVVDAGFGPPEDRTITHLPTLISDVCPSTLPLGTPGSRISRALASGRTSLHSFRTGVLCTVTSSRYALYTRRISLSTRINASVVVIASSPVWEE